HDDISINTLIGSGSFIQGSLKVKGFMRFDGDIDGDLETTGRLIIGEKARIRGNVRALSAIIHGIVEGDVTAPEGIKLFSTASVIGDVSARKVYAEEKVFIQGQCIILLDKTEYENAAKAWQDEKAIRAKSFFGTGSTS
ncbi:MAG: polymer-forming cytoskeletal protein, partial [Spirochaetales bacterium]